jgi:ATPase subunit of ABC transporter with duplicated ATPase domains
MTHPYLTLDNVSCALPDGRTLFSGINDIIDHRHTGLVGRNGVGKSILARIMAGQILPSTGRCIRTGNIYYLAQQVSLPEHATVASLAGVEHILAALARIEAGSSAVNDFDIVGDHWDIHQRLQTALSQYGLGYLDADTPALTLSGGQAMRVALAGAVLSEADLLILDEPSNHLDRTQRHILTEQLQQWPRGLLVISHDRPLLDTMERIIELSSLGLRSYSGNYSVYTDSKQQERQNALAELEQRKLERQREAQSMQHQHDRQARKEARGNRQGKEANQAKILLGRQKERSESSAGKLRQQQEATREQLNQRVRDAAQQLDNDAPIIVHTPTTTQVARRRIAELDNVTLPYVSAATRHIHLTVHGQQRIGIIGPNGYGKSTLLKVLAHHIEPLSGTCHTSADAVYLDQQLSSLAPDQTVLAQLQTANPAATEGNLRMLLAHLDLDAQKIMVPSGSLSGGERLKAALACLLYADPPPQLLLLDEPSNHLDLPSTEALETMLRSYQGALVVVSHDDVLMQHLALTDRLEATDAGWRLSSW